MPATESAVMDDNVTGAVVAKATRTPKKKAKVDTSAIRTQIKEERTVLKLCKEDLKDSKADLRETLKSGKAKVTEATKTLKAAVAIHAKEVKADEKNIAACEKVVTKQQVVIDKLTAKLG